MPTQKEEIEDMQCNHERPECNSIISGVLQRPLHHAITPIKNDAIVRPTRVHNGCNGLQNIGYEK